MWVSYVENGRLTASPEMERTILTAIARLAQLKETVRASKEALAEELKDERAVGASIR
jgi:predicted GIY-YIG superfamily endonuclease